MARSNAGARDWDRVAFRFQTHDQMARAKAAAARQGVSVNDLARALLCAATADEPLPAAPELLTTGGQQSIQAPDARPAPPVATNGVHAPEGRA